MKAHQAAILALLYFANLGDTYAMVICVILFIVWLYSDN